MAWYADGRFDEVDLSEVFTVAILGRQTMEEAMVLGDQVLIGVTVREKLDLLVDCPYQRLIPNPAHSQQPAFWV